MYLNKDKFSSYVNNNPLYLEYIRDEISEGKDYRIHKPFDKFFKNLMVLAGEGLMAIIGYPIEIKHFHDSEKVNEILGELHIDKLLESLEEIMFIVEFQTNPITNDDKRRFGSYQALVHKETKKEVIVIIISMTAKEDSHESYGYGDEYMYTPHIISLTKLDTYLYLNNIKDIALNKKRPSTKDIAALLLIPLMEEDREKSKKLIFETSKIANSLSGLDESTLKSIKINQSILAQAMLDEDEISEYVRIGKMDDEEFFENFGKYIEQIEIKKARDESKSEIISNILSKGLSFAETAELTGLAIDEISRISRAK